MTTLLRDHDPAADANPSAASPVAAAMLADILSTPRTTESAARPRHAVRAGVLVGTAAAISLALPVFWPGGDNPSSAAAYAVDRNRDGSVDVAIDYEDFRDPAALQRALDDLNVRAVVLTGSTLPWELGRDRSGRSLRVPDCARFTPLPIDLDASPDDPSQPMSFHLARQFQDVGLRLRPDLLPADGVFVIEIVLSGGVVGGVSGDVAIGPAP